MENEQIDPLTLHLLNQLADEMYTTVLKRAREEEEKGNIVEIDVTRDDILASLIDRYRDGGLEDDDE